MSALSLIEQLKNIQSATGPGAEDTADKLNFVWTPILLIICSLAVFGKEYLGKPIQCIFSGNKDHQPTGFGDFAESYCWAYGTYAYNKDSEIKLSGFNNLSEKDEYWTKTLAPQLQSFYQWVPFFLLTQCFMAFVPKLVWQLIFSQRFGSDVYSLVSLAAETKTSDDQGFKKQASRIADVIERMLLYNREFRNGKLERFKTAMYSQCSFLVPSKRMGTMLCVLYLIVKLLCVANAFLQLVLMAIFLGFWHRGVFMYGWVMLEHIKSGRGWQETMFFPLRTLCYFTTKLDFGATNAYVGQCTLPVNILNEKIFILLFFWYLLLALVTSLSIVRWLCRLLCSQNRVSFVKHFLSLSEPGLQVEKLAVKSFINKFLRHDGLFLVLMLAEGSNKVITTEVVRLLFQRWVNKHHGCDLRLWDCFSLSTAGLKTPPCTSTAVDESGLMSG